GESERTRESTGAVGRQILVADQMDRDVALIEPTRDMCAPTRKLLPKLMRLPVCSSAEGGILVVDEGNGLIDTAAIVIGERGRDVARVAHDHDRGLGAAPTGEQRLAFRRQRVGVVYLDEAHRRR